MRVTRILIGGAAMLASAALAAERTLERQLEEVVRSGEAGDCAKILKATAAVSQHRDWPALEGDVRVAILLMRGACRLQAGAPDAAYQDLLAATAIPESDETAWHLRLAYEVERGLHPAAVATVEAMTKGHGAALNALDQRLLYGLDARLSGRDLLPLRRRLLAVLTDESYRPEEPNATADAFRERYAGLLLDAGDRAAAVALVRRITWPSLVLDASLDARLRDAFATDPDIAALLERKLIEDRAVASRHPTMIGPVIAVAQDLRGLGRPREALAALDAIRAQVTGKAELLDRDRQAVWWWDEVSRAHMMAGDAPAALAALEAGARLNEDGSKPVSLPINLALLRLTLGDAAGAMRDIAVVADGRSLSPYGQMQVALTRACAGAIQGRPSATDIAYVRAHADDAPADLTHMLLCLGDDDAAAASLIARLDDPGQRTRALRDLSRYAPPPAALPARDWRVQLDRLRTRSDVVAAVARAGGTRRFNVQDTSF